MLLNMVRHILAERATSLLAVAVLCAALGFSAGSANADSWAFLPLDAMEVAAQDQASQSQALSAIVKAVRASEVTQSEGDASFRLTEYRTNRAYEAAAAFAAGLGTPGSGQIALQDRETFLRPFVRVTRLVTSGAKTRYESRLLRDPADKPDKYDEAIAVSDGTRSTCLAPLAGTGRVEKGNATEIRKAYEPWLTLGTVASKPVSAIMVLPSARYEGRQSVGDTDCLKVSAVQDSVKYEIWISPANGYRVKRIARTRNGPGADWATSIGEVDSFKEYGDGLWFPNGGKHAEFVAGEATEDKLFHGVKWSVTSYSSAAASSAFSLALPLGTKMVDATAEKPLLYKVGE